MSVILRRISKQIIISGQTIFKRNAGHSKWQNIRHIKGAKDAERANLFTRLARQMKVAVQEGGSADPKANLKLEQVIEQAKRSNMPVATIQNVLKSTQNDKTQCKVHLLDIRGPGGCSILCEVYTASLHQLRQNIATILKKHGSKYSEGAGLHNFEEKGIIEVELNENSKSEKDIVEQATEHAIETGAEDVTMIGNILEFTCDPRTLLKVSKDLEKFSYNVVSSSVEYIPIKLLNISDTNYQLYVSLCKKLDSLPETIRMSDNVEEIGRAHV